MSSLFQCPPVETRPASAMPSSFFFVSKHNTGALRGPCVYSNRLCGLLDRKTLIHRVRTRLSRRAFFLSSCELKARLKASEYNSRIGCVLCWTRLLEIFFWSGCVVLTDDLTVTLFRCYFNILHLPLIDRHAVTHTITASAYLCLPLVTTSD